MSERICMQCKKTGLSLPHLRVWEENTDVSLMICFCSIEHMLLFYTGKLADIKENIRKLNPNAKIEEINMKIVTVAFKVSEENSVHYSKKTLPTPEINLEGANFEALAGHELLVAFLKGADFVSVRFIRKEGETSE